MSNTLMITYIIYIVPSILCSKNLNNFTWVSIQSVVKHHRKRGDVFLPPLRSLRKNNLVLLLNNFFEFEYNYIHVIFVIIFLK